jgi:hypothetical protein
MMEAKNGLDMLVILALAVHSVGQAKCKVRCSIRR